MVSLNVRITLFVCLLFRRLRARRQRRRFYLTRETSPKPQNSPVFGFDRTAFDVVLYTFKLHCIGMRKRVLAAVDVLGLVLHWSNSSSRKMFLNDIDDEVELLGTNIPVFCGLLSYLVFFSSSSSCSLPRASSGSSAVDCTFLAANSPVCQCATRSETSDTVSVNLTAYHIDYLTGPTHQGTFM